MQFLVSQMRAQGRALEQRQIRSAESVWGEVQISHSNVPELGRYSDVATVRASGQNGALPPLYDVRISHMGPQGFVLSGLTLVGSVAFAQAWWLRAER